MRNIGLEPVLFGTFNAVFMVCIVIVTLYPFLNTIAVSLNAGNDTIRGGIYLLPRSGLYRTTKPFLPQVPLFLLFGFRLHEQ